MFTGLPLGSLMFTNQPAQAASHEYRSVPACSCGMASARSQDALIQAKASADCQQLNPNDLIVLICFVPKGILTYPATRCYRRQT